MKSLTRTRIIRTIWYIINLNPRPQYNSFNIKKIQRIENRIDFKILEFSISLRHLTGRAPPSSDGWCISWSSSEDHSFSQISMLSGKIFTFSDLSLLLSRHNSSCDKIFLSKSNKRGRNLTAFYRENPLGGLNSLTINILLWCCRG